METRPGAEKYNSKSKKTSRFGRRQCESRPAACTEGGGGEIHKSKYTADKSDSLLPSGAGNFAKKN